MNFTILLTTVLVFVAPWVCSAQVLSYDGFLVTNAGDTIRGKVEDWGPFRNSKGVWIIKTGESKTTFYSPSEVKLYKLNGVVYESKNVVSTSKTQQLFLMPMVKGKLSIYKNGNSFYATRDTLGYSFSVTKGKTETNKRARGLVKLLVLDCKSINADSAVMQEAEMRKLALRYNACVGSPSEEYKSNPEKRRITWGVFAGEIVSNLNMTKDIQHVPDYKPFTFKPAHSLVFGVSAELGRRDTPSLYTELSYFSTNFSGSASGLSSTGEKYYNLNFIRFAAGVRLKFRARFAQPFVSVGLSQLFTASIAGLERNFTNATNYSQFVPALSASNPQAFWVGAGFRRRFSERFGMTLEGRIEKATGFVRPTTVIVGSESVTSSSSFSNSSVMMSLIF